MLGTEVELTRLEGGMTPFIVTGVPRTGTTLLTTSLAQHHLVRCHGEIFHTVRPQRQGRHAIKLAHGASVYFGGDPRDDPIDFLRHWVWGDSWLWRPRAVGFKMFIDHHPSVFIEQIGEEILPPTLLLKRLRAEINGLMVLHCCRANYLDVYLSRLLALRTMRWVSNDTETPPTDNTEPLVMDPGKALKFFQRMQFCDSYLWSVFGMHSASQYLRVDYENLVADLQGTVDRAFDALNVNSIKVSPAIEKQVTLSRAQLIKNYAEVARHFDGTTYSKFFDKEDR